MSTTEKATPRPWRIGFPDGSGVGTFGSSYPEGAWVVGRNHVVVAGNNGDGAPGGVVGADAAEQKANAELIVRAVNTHEELIALARAVVDWYESRTENIPATRTAFYEQARHALTLVEGKEGI